ncbi:acyltransferase family protein [Rhodoplanes sp. TEM]|uniref:acyltransferase family protein n=1 Tax=Rhodoplanes sp. TEM TaxID=3025489 RepID=UPI00234FF31B|nr:acyltransferase family protein [Rhodoplanes sp. TEM]
MAAHVETGYRADIDGLRAVAILPVVCFHAFPAAMPGGFVGVDVFFVISGYLISGIILSQLDRGTFGLADYYARRVRRIFPALGVVLSTSYVTGWWLLYPDEFKQLCKHIAAGAAFVANFALRREVGYFDGAAETKPMLHLWSLGVEEQFYIVWPLLLWAAVKARANLRTVILAALAVSLAWNLWAVGADDPRSFFSPLVRVWELATGALLAQAGAGAAGPGAPRRSLGRDALSVVGAALLVGAVLLIDREMPFPGWRAAVPVAGTALLIAAGPGALVNRTVLANPLMVGIGLISYPLYLWHWPLLSFAHVAVLDAAEPLVRGLAVAAAFGLAWATWRFVERPLRFGRLRRVAVPGLAAALVAIGGVAWATNKADGLPGRVPAETGGLASWRYDTAPAYRSGTCFLEELRASAFGDCVDPPAAGPRLVFLWGDSHAAHLYAGLRTAAPRMAQYTASGCPPLLETDFGYRANCRVINEAVLERLVRLAPHTVVLAAHWKDHDWRRLDATLAALERAGVPRVVVVGPVPQWQIALPKVLLRYAARSGGAYPERTSWGLASEIGRLDHAMKPFVEARGGVYVSPYAALCDARGCLTHVGPVPDGLITFDGHHLTVVGATHVVRTLALP